MSHRSITICRPMQILNVQSWEDTIPYSVKLQLSFCYLRQVNEVNGGDNAFVRCVCVFVCVFVCAQRPVMGVKCQ